MRIALHPSSTGGYSNRAPQDQARKQPYIQIRLIDDARNDEERNEVTYDHTKRTTHNKVCERAADHSVYAVIISPLQTGYSDDERLKEGDGERVGVHEHCGGHCEVSNDIRKGISV